MPQLKTYKITDTRTGETFSISSATPPTKKQVKGIIDQRAETKLQGEKANLDYKNRGFFPKLAETVYAPSEAVAPVEMPQKEVEKLPTGQRIRRLGQELASGLLDPSNIPGIVAPVVLGPVGVAGAGIAYGPQMLKGLYESGKAAIEDPSLETVARAGTAAAMTGLAGYGIKQGMKGYGTPKPQDFPTVKAPITDRAKLLESQNSDPIIDAEFVDSKQIEGKNTIHYNKGEEQKQITFGDIGPIKAPEAGDPYVAGSSPLEADLIQKQIGASGQRQIGAMPEVKSPFEMPKSEMEGKIPYEAEFVNSAKPKELSVSAPGEIIGEGRVVGEQRIRGQQRLLETSYPELLKKRTSTLLQLREKAQGKELEVVNDVLKKRGALPDSVEDEILVLDESVKPKESQVTEEPKVTEDLTVKEPESVALTKEKSPESETQKVQAPIENNWLREQDSKVLQSMRDGASGKLREEIDFVLEERGLTKTDGVRQDPIKFKFDDPNITIPVSQEFGDALRRMSPKEDMPDSVSLTGGKQGEAAIEALENKLGRTPQPEEIADILGMIQKINGTPEGQTRLQRVTKLRDILGDEFVEENIQGDIRRIKPGQRFSDVGKDGNIKQESLVKSESKIDSSSKDVVIKRSDDFQTSGEYDVTFPNGSKTKIYRDPENGWWYEANTGKHHSKSVIGFNKAEAIQRLLDDKLESPKELEVKNPLDESIDETVSDDGPLTEETQSLPEDLQTFEEKVKNGKIDWQDPAYGERIEESFKNYQAELESLTEIEHPTKSSFDELVRYAKEAGLEDEAIVDEVIENAHPSTTNIANKMWAAIKRWNESKGEAGSVPLGEILKTLKEKVKGTQDEGLIKTISDQIGRLRAALPRLKPESNIGRMGDIGLKIERAMEDGQFESDRLQGKLDTLIHDAFKGLTPREIGQRIATLDNGKEIVTNKKNFDKYVTWDKGQFTPKKGVSEVGWMRGSLYDVINNGAEPATPAIANAAKLFKQAMDILGTEGEGSKVSTVSPGGKYIEFKKMGENYWPRDYTEGFYESLKKDPTNWNRIIAEVAKEKNLSIKEVEELFKDRRKFAELTTKGQHTRTLKQDVNAIDPNVVLDHIKNFSGRIGMAKALGSKDITGGWLAKDIAILLDQGFDSDYVNKTISRLVGREQNKPPSKLESGIYKTVTDLNNWRLMTSFMLNNLANITPTVARVGEGNTLKGLSATLANFEIAKRMETLAGSTMHTGTIDRSGASVAKLLGIPASERFMRTWAGQTGRFTATQAVDYLNTLDPKSAAYGRWKGLLDSLLGKDSTETIKKGSLTPDELDRASWTLAKDTQGIVNPGTMPPLAETIQFAPLRLGVNLALQYKRMAVLGMSSMMESLRLNPARTIRTLAITAPIIGELIGDAGSAIFGSIAGAYTGEGAVKAAIRDVEDRGKSLAKMMKPLLQDKMGLSESQANLVGRYIEDLNRGFALGLIGDFIYSASFWGNKAAADIVAGGIGPAGEFIWDITKAIGNDIEDILKYGGNFKRGSKFVNGRNQLQKDLGQTLKVLAPQRPVSAINRSEGQKSKGGGGITVHPPSLPSLP